MYSIRSGNEENARRYIKLLLDVLPALQMESSDVSELGEKYSGLMADRFSPKSGKWCAAQFAAKGFAPQ
jgi:hypothetical protein